MRIFIIGFMGSGKTTLGKVLAEKIGLEFVDLDEYIEQKHKYSIASIFSLVGEEGFRKVEKVCLNELAQKDNVLISTGGGTPFFFDNMDVMNQSGKTVYLKVSPETLIERLAVSRMEYRPLIKGKNISELSDYIYDTLANRSIYYEKAHHIFDGEHDSMDHIAERLVSSMVLV